LKINDKADDASTPNVDVDAIPPAAVTHSSICAYRDLNLDLSTFKTKSFCLTLVWNICVRFGQSLSTRSGVIVLTGHTPRRTHVFTDGHLGSIIPLPSGGQIGHCRYDKKLGGALFEPTCILFVLVCVVL